MKNHSINLNNEIRNYALRAGEIDGRDAMDTTLTT